MKISFHFSSEVLQADSSLKERSNQYSIIMRLQTHLFYLQKRVDYLEKSFLQSPSPISMLSNEGLFAQYKSLSSG